MAAAGKLNWDDLRFFLHSAQAKSLSGAARAMAVEHTTVGRRLSALERALGAPLFVRGPDGLRLTLLGAQIAPRVEELERAVQAIAEQVAFQTLRVRVAMPSGFTRLFSESLARLRTQHPEIALEMISGARSVDLRRGEAHLALRIGQIADEDLVARKLGDIGFSLYASAAYLARKSLPVDVSDLSGHEVIGYDAILSETPPARWIAAHAEGAVVVLRSREMTDVLSAASSGVGLAVLPCMLGDESPELKRVASAVLTSHPLWLVYSREVRMVDAVRAVIRFVAATVRQNANRLAGKESPHLRPR